ncbi:MAG: hypothetical protein AAGK97_07230, partial [Bacteroidota bacterium]
NWSKGHIPKSCEKVNINQVGSSPLMIDFDVAHATIELLEIKNATLHILDGNELTIDVNYELNPISPERGIFLDLN